MRKEDWISVNDTMPVKDKTVLCWVIRDFLGKFERLEYTQELCLGINGRWGNDEFYLDEDEEVSHWMEIVNPWEE